MQWRSRRKLCHWEPFQACLGASRSQELALLALFSLLLYFLSTLFFCLTSSTVRKFPCIYMMLWLKSHPLGFVEGRQKILALGNQYSGGALLAFQVLIYASWRRWGCAVSVSPYPARSILPAQYHPPHGAECLWQGSSRSYLLLFWSEQFVLSCHT